MVRYKAISKFTSHLGFQLLEIEAIPLGGREAKRRRKIEQQEAMKEKEAQNAAAAAATPDYAAGLGQAVGQSVSG